MLTFACSSCKENIDGDTLIVVGECKYGNRNDSKSLYTITYKTVNVNNGLTIYVVSDSKDFEVGDKVKLVKIEE